MGDSQQELDLPSHITPALMTVTTDTKSITPSFTFLQLQELTGMKSLSNGNRQEVSPTNASLDAKQNSAGFLKVYGGNEVGVTAEHPAASLNF